MPSEELFKVIVPSQAILKSRHLFEMVSFSDWEGNAHMQTDVFCLRQLYFLAAYNGIVICSNGLNFSQDCPFLNQLGVRVFKISYGS